MSKNINFDIIGISEDMKTLILSIGDVTIPVTIDIQNISDISGYDIPIVRSENVEGTDTWVELERIKPLELTSEILESAIKTNADLHDFVEETYEGWGEENKEQLEKERLDEYIRVAHIALMKHLESAVAMEKLDEGDKRILKKCPKCKRYTFCNEHGDKKVYCGYGKYDYYTTCQNCGEEFVVNSL